MPLNLRDLFGIYTKSELEFIEYLQELGLLSKKYLCPKCGGDMQLCSTLTKNSEYADEFMWLCSQGTMTEPHNVSRPIRRGSWFDESNLSLKTIYLLTYMWIYEYSEKLVAHEMKTDMSTVCNWFTLCREICQAIVNRSGPIGGPGKIVEIDEANFAPNKCYQGRVHENQWVYAGVQQDSNRCFLVVVSSNSAESLLEVIKTHVLPESIIYSTCWKSYKCLRDENYRDIKKTHSFKFRYYTSEFAANNWGNTWSVVKKKMPANRNKEHLASFLAEYIYRKCFKSDYDPFLKFLEDIKEVCIPSHCDESML